MSKSFHFLYKQWLKAEPKYQIFIYKADANWKAQQHNISEHVREAFNIILRYGTK